jgi:hypothetical protein
MNHKTTILGLAAIVAAVAITASVFAVPQQALAGGHHHHNNNGVKVNQQIDQLNACSLAVCVNQGNNTADIDR